MGKCALCSCLRRVPPRAIAELSVGDDAGDGDDEMHEDDNV